MSLKSSPLLVVLNAHPLKAIISSKSAALLVVACIYTMQSLSCMHVDNDIRFSFQIKHDPTHNFTFDSEKEVECKYKKFLGVTMLIRKFSSSKLGEKEV